MARPDDDIQFDFFDDPPTSEAAQGIRARLPQRGGRDGGRPTGPVGPPAPIRRLIGIVVAVGVVLFFFAYLVQGCTSDSRHQSYANYMSKVSAIAQQSTLDGKKTVGVLTASGLKVADIVGKLRGIANLEQQNVDAAEALTAPGRLRVEQSNLIESLQLRVSGVNGLATAFQTMISTKSGDGEEATLLSEQAYRLLASDIVWADLFQKPSADQLKADGVGDVAPPQSAFLANPDYVITQNAMLQIVKRLLGETTTSSGTCDPSAIHGTNLQSVAAFPNGTSGTSQVLNAGSGALNTITTGASLVFQVTIHNGGNFQEVQIPVNLTILRPSDQGTSITRTTKVLLIDPGTDQTVSFGDVQGIPFASKTKLTVTVGKVPCETNTANNSATYDVLFSLPS